MAKWDVGIRGYTVRLERRSSVEFKLMIGKKFFGKVIGKGGVLSRAGLEQVVGKLRDPGADSDIGLSLGGKALRIYPAGAGRRLEMDGNSIELTAQEVQQLIAAAEAALEE